MTIFAAFHILAQTDGDLLRTVKEPGFAQWFVYLLVFLMVVDRLKGWIDRDKPKKTEVSGSLKTSPEETFATTAEVSALKEEIKGLSEEGEAQHNEARRNAEHRVADLARAVDEESKELGNKIDKLTDKLELGVNGLREKIDAAILLSTAHHAEIPHLKDRYEELISRYNRDLEGLNNRINDAMNAATAAAAGVAALTAKGGKA